MYTWTTRAVHGTQADHDVDDDDDDDDDADVEKQLSLHTDSR